MYLKIKNSTILSIVIIFMITMLFGCKNDIAKVNSLTSEEKIPDEQTQNVTIVYSDSGNIQFVLTSILMRTFIVSDPYTEFPSGLKIVSYDSKQKPKTTLTANYAIRYDGRKYMEAKSKVVIINHQDNERIETESIIWDQKQRKIYSDVFVKRTNANGILFGDGFDADETFSRYTIRNPRATFYFEENPD